jgi:prephenate dehydrogenase
MIFNKTLIIGLGLIGGSFARALKIKNLSKEIYAFDSNMESINFAKTEKVIDGFVMLEDDISDFDLIVISTNLSSYQDIFKKLSLSKIKKTSLVIDFGSLKEFIKKILPKNLTDNFIGCHPIVGSEKSGFLNSNFQLFFESKIVVCSNKESSQSKIKSLTEIFEKMDAKLEFLDEKKHDEIYGLVSHLPQFLSFLTKEFSPENIQNQFLTKCFRLDNSSPEMWDDIFKINQNNLEKFYVIFFENLEKNIDQQNFLLKDFSYLTNQKSNQENCDLDDDFFAQNFTKIFFRVLVVLSYLEIPQIKKYQTFAGNGFKDFTSIISLLKIKQKNIPNLFEENKNKIKKMFLSLT